MNKDKIMETTTNLLFVLSQMTVLAWKIQSRDRTRMFWTKYKYKVYTGHNIRILPCVSVEQRRHQCKNESFLSMKTKQKIRTTKTKYGRRTKRFRSCTHFYCELQTSQQVMYENIHFVFSILKNQFTNEHPLTFCNYKIQERV